MKPLFRQWKLDCPEFLVERLDVQRGVTAPHFAPVRSTSHVVALITGIVKVGQT